MQAYSDPSRASDPTALPDVEVFYVEPGGWTPDELRGDMESTRGPALEDGWYWWSCFPGCLPDGDPVGPFDSEATALADARGDG
jgi:hypothetical protein